MTSSNRNVVFDVVGTLVGYERLFDTIDAHLGSTLRSENIKPSLFGQMWIETAEREYTYLSMSVKYAPFAIVVRAIFYRMLFKAGISRPREFASEQDLEHIMAEGYDQLEMRRGAKECIQTLRDGGFKVWALTAADKAGCAAYFQQAGVTFPEEDILSCDGSGVGKPDLEAYRPLLEQLCSEGQSRPWFAAAHAWDTSAAMRAGFRGAYCSVFEQEPLPELFGEMDVVEETLVGMAKRIVATYGE